MIDTLISWLLPIGCLLAIYGMAKLGARSEKKYESEMTDEELAEYKSWKAW